MLLTDKPANQQANRSKQGRNLLDGDNNVMKYSHVAGLPASTTSWFIITMNTGVWNVFLMQMYESSCCLRNTLHMEEENGKSNCWTQPDPTPHPIWPAGRPDLCKFFCHVKCSSRPHSVYFMSWQLFALQKLPQKIPMCILHFAMF